MDRLQPKRRNRVEHFNQGVGVGLFEIEAHRGVGHIVIGPPGIGDKYDPTPGKRRNWRH